MPMGAEGLSLWIASILPMSVREKHDMLAGRDTAARLRTCERLLTGFGDRAPSPPSRLPAAVAAQAYEAYEQARLPGGGGVGASGSSSGGDSSGSSDFLDDSSAARSRSEHESGDSGGRSPGSGNPDASDDACANAEVPPVAAGAAGDGASGGSSAAQQGVVTAEADQTGQGRNSADLSRPMSVDSGCGSDVRLPSAQSAEGGDRGGGGDSGVESGGARAGAAPSPTQTRSPSGGSALGRHTPQHTRDSDSD